MSETETTGIGVGGLLGVAFVVLKLTGVIRKPSRSAARYQAYLRADRCASFGEWLKLKGTS